MLGARRLAPQLARAINLETRAASSLAAEAAAEARAAEYVHVNESAPPLVKLPQRQWGARHALAAADVLAATGGAAPDRLAVVRHAFAPFDHAPHPLADILKSLSPGQVAVQAAVGEPHERVLVDEYARGADGYALQRTGMDLLRWLREHSVRVCFVPDVHAVHGFNSHTGAMRSLLQSTNEVLMVAPTAFTFNDQAAQDNSFMHAGLGGGAPAGESVTRRVLREFAGLHHALTERAGVRVTLFEHAPEHGTPDAVFPNNWFSTHGAAEGDGAVGRSTLVLYPMKCPNRQAERRADILAVLRGRGYERLVDLTAHEGEGRYFEGTGVLVLDRINGVAYCALSERAHVEAAERWAEALGYQQLVTFTSRDARGATVYHTNVMMAVGTDCAVVCAESVDDDREREHLLASLRKRHQVVEISRAQMDALCGNVLELQDGRGLPVLALSSRSFNAFSPEQRACLRRHVADLVHAPIDTLEYIGGGGVRCTLGELF